VANAASPRNHFYPGISAGLLAAKLHRCIFGNPDQWAGMRCLAPDWYERIAAHEDGFGRSIERTHGIRVLAHAGPPTRP
jgi:hypothetical protein